MVDCPRLLLPAPRVAAAQYTPGSGSNQGRAPFSVCFSRLHRRWSSVPVRSSSSGAGSQSSVADEPEAAEWALQDFYTLRKDVELAVERVNEVRQSAGLEQLEEDITSLETKSTDSSLWDDPSKAQEILVSLTEVKDRVKLLNDFKLQVEEAETIVKLTEELDSIDTGLLEEASKIIKALNKALDNFEMTQLLSGPYDKEGAVINISAGAGGTDAQDWADMLLRMYVRWGEKQRYKTRVVEKSPGEEAGIKSATVELEGRYAYGYISGEKGTHRIVRQSPFNAKGLRQTSFAGVEVMPLLPEESMAVDIPEEDLDISFTRAGGKGGAAKPEATAGLQDAPLIEEAVQGGGGGHGDGGAQEQSPGTCDLYKGRWVYDESRAPLYKESDCSFLTEQVTCTRNGRRDDDYQKWRWQPDGCDLPRFDAKLLLEKLRNKRLMFVGDSLNRNQWESMVCLVQSEAPWDKKSLVKNGSLNVFHLQEYNATVEFYWAPFLVESNSDDPDIHSISDRMIKPTSIAKHAANWEGVDYLIFNTYIWWMNTPQMKTLHGGSFSRKHVKYDEIERVEAYRKVLKTWSRWVEAHIDPKRTTVLFMSVSPVHMQSEGWGSPNAIKCFSETQPAINYTKKLEVGTDWDLFATAQRVTRSMKKVPVHFINITALSEIRKDAHTSVHTLRQGKLLTAEQKANPRKFADCIHWCLPGVPDTWNEFVYGHIVSSPPPQQQITEDQPHR